jgi:hypothetical protein
MRTTPLCHIDLADHPYEVIFNRIDYVDDTSDVTTALKVDIAEIHRQVEEKLTKDCEKLGLKLNNDKTKTMVMNGELQTEKFLGYQINNKINANSELPVFLNRLSKVTNTTRSCSFLSKFDRMRITKWQVLSVLWPITFLYTYLNPTKLAKVRTSINGTFKSASYLSRRTPTIDIENYLYGMSFEEYLDHRFLRVSNRFIKFGSKIFEPIKLVRKTYRPKPRCKRGTFVEKYIKILNENFNPKHLLLNKKQTQKLAYKNIIQFQRDIPGYKNSDKML